MTSFNLTERPMGSSAQRRWPAPALALIVATLASTPAVADVEEGDRCTASVDLDVRFRSNRGQMVLPISKGDSLEVLSIGGDYARVRSGELVGTVRLSELENACRPAARRCQLTKPVTIEQVPDGTGRRWKIKPGAVLTVTEQLPAFSRVTIGPVEGYVPSDELSDVCVVVDAPDNGDEDAPEGADQKPQAKRQPVALPPVLPGKQVVFAPLSIGPDASGDMATLLEDQLAAALDDRRTDVSPPGSKRPSAASRQTDLKTHIKDLLKPARDAGVSYLVTGQLTRLVQERTPTKTDEEREAILDMIDAPDEERDHSPEVISRDILVIVVFDVARTKVARSVKVEPSLAVGHTWAKQVAAALDQALPSSGLRAGARTDVDTSTVTVAADDDDAPGIDASPDGVGWIEPEDPVSTLVWIGSGVLGGAALTLVLGAAVGAGSLALGYLTSTSVQTDPQRPTYAAGALGTGVSADALFIVTGGLVVVGGFLILAGVVSE